MIDEADVGVQQDGDVAIPQQDVAIGAASLSLEKNSIATKKSTTKKFNAASAVEKAPKKLKPYSTLNRILCQRLENKKITTSDMMTQKAITEST